MICINCNNDHYVGMEDGSDYCPSCGYTHIPSYLLERPDDLPDYNPIPKGGWSVNPNDDLPF